MSQKPQDRRTFIKTMAGGAVVLRSSLAYHKSYGKTGRARDSYASLGSGEKASACRDCGACEKACPYGVAVRSRIREAGRILA